MSLDAKGKHLLADELVRRKLEENVLLQKAHIEKKNQITPFARYYVQQFDELNEEEERYNNVAKAALNIAEIKKAEDLAVEMNRLKKEEIRDERLRQILRQTSPELKELEVKLRAAYNCKILRAQIQEKEAARIKDKLREREAHDLLLKARVDDLECKRRLKEQRIRQQHQYKMELQDQMIHRERSKRFQYEEFLREKKVIDDLIERMHDENERMMQVKYAKQLKTMEEIKAFHEAQEIWKAKARKQIEEEDLKIKEYIREKLEQERKRISDKAQQEAIKAAICDELAKKIYKEKRTREERNQIIMELKEEEQREAFEKEAKEKLEKEIKRRLEIFSSLKAQMKDRVDRLKKEAEEDAAYKEHLIAKIAEDERLEQLSKEKKRLKMLQIRKDVHEMMVQKRQQKAEEMQELLKIQDIEKAELEKRREIIEEERLKMLREHAVNLIGCIPPGVLREDDYEKLNIDGEFNKKMYCK